MLFQYVLRRIDHFIFLGYDSKTRAAYYYEVPIMRGERLQLSESMKSVFDAKVIVCGKFYMYDI